MRTITLFSLTVVLLVACEAEPEQGRECTIHWVDSCGESVGAPDTTQFFDEEDDFQALVACQAPNNEDGDFPIGSGRAQCFVNAYLEDPEMTQGTCWCECGESIGSFDPPDECDP